MSDISIPGVSSRFNTDQMVEKLVEAERVTLTRMENRVSEFEEQKKSWQEMTRQLSSLTESARKLYSFENPFNERIASSSDESVLTAQATRAALEGETEIEVIRVASADRFSSSDLPRDLRVEQGVYTFGVGDSRAVLRFRGGTLREFSEALNRVNPELIASNVINNRPGTQVFLLEARRQGEENRLSFMDEASNELAQKLGLIAPSSAGRISPSLDPANLGLSAAQTRSDSVRLQNEVLQVDPGTSLRIPLRAAAGQTSSPIDSSMLLEFQARYQPLAEESGSSIGPPPGFQLEPGQGIVFQGLALPDLPSTAPDPAYEVPAPAPRVDRGDVLSLLAGSQEQSLPLVSSQEFQTVRIPLQDLPFLPEFLAVKNENTHRIIEIKDLQIYDPNARGDYTASNPLSLARDAILKVQGIEVQRSSNSIDDVIPGVTLNLRSPSKTPLTLRVSPDRDMVKDALIEYVGAYNQVIRDINILTRTQAEIIDEITYFTPEEREAAIEKLGSFQGNSTLNMIRQRMQNLVLSPVSTDAGQSMALLAQAGISTNAAGGAGTGVQASRLRGYLEINENALDQALERNFNSVKQLFGIDTDGDMIVDAGIAYQTETLLRPFIQTGGILASNTATLDRQISRTQGEITDYQRYLEDYEQRMRIQFGQMESAINSLEAQSRDIQNLNPSSSSSN